MPLIEWALKRAIESSPLEYDDLGDQTHEDWVRDVGALIAAYLSDPEVVYALALHLPGSSFAYNQVEATALLQAIGAKVAP